MTHLETAAPTGTDDSDDAEGADRAEPDPGGTTILLPAPLDGGIDLACYSTRRCHCGEWMEALHSPAGHAWRCHVCGRRQKR